MCCEKIFICIYCKTTFCDVTELDAHLENEHCIDIEDYITDHTKINKNKKNVPCLNKFPITLLSTCTDKNLLKMKCIDAYVFVDQTINCNRINDDSFQECHYNNWKLDYFSKCIWIFYNYILDKFVQKKLFNKINYSEILFDLVNDMTNDNSFCFYFHLCYRWPLYYAIDYVCNPSDKIKSNKIKCWFSQQICIAIKKNIKLILIILSQTNMYPCENKIVINGLNSLLKCMTQEVLEKTYPGYRHAKTFLKRLRHSV